MVPGVSTRISRLLATFESTWLGMAGVEPMATHTRSTKQYRRGLTPTIQCFISLSARSALSIYCLQTLRM